MMANFGSGSISVIRVKEDGSLGELTAFIQNVGGSVDPSIQTAPHPHWIGVSPDNRYVIVSDLGLDKVLIFFFYFETRRLSPPDPRLPPSIPAIGAPLAFVPRVRLPAQREMRQIVESNTDP
jgi:6-phosphogluconolactonase